MKFYLEMHMVKEILFDKLQLDAIEIISKVDQFIKIFLCQDTTDIFKDYVIGDSNSNVFNSIREISNRKTKLNKLNTISGLKNLDADYLNQGKCGGCWAFSQSVLLTYIYNKNKPENEQSDIIFSPQVLFDCFHKNSLGILGLNSFFLSINGCQGGDPYDVARGVLTLLNRQIAYPNAKEYKFLNKEIESSQKNDGYGDFSRDKCQELWNSPTNQNHIPSFPRESTERWTKKDISVGFLVIRRAFTMI